MELQQQDLWRVTVLIFSFKLILYKTKSKNIIDFDYCFRPLELTYVKTTTDIPKDHNMPN